MDQVLQKGGSNAVQSVLNYLKKQNPSLQYQCKTRQSDCEFDVDTEMTITSRDPSSLRQILFPKKIARITNSARGISELEVISFDEDIISTKNLRKLVSDTSISKALVRAAFKSRSTWDYKFFTP